MRSRNPRTTSFVDCGDGQMAAVGREVKKLGRKLAVRQGRRLKTCHKGRVNLARTVRLSMKTGQVPVKRVRMAPKPSKPDIWMICDVSNSVRKFIYFMMTLVYATQKSYSQIRSFMFVDNLMESTDYLLFFLHTSNEWLIPKSRCSDTSSSPA